MNGETESDEIGPGIDPMLIDPPDFLFEIWVGKAAKARVFGDREKRNWVFWKLSQYVIALSEQGTVSVKRYINGAWENADDWRKLAH